MVFGLVIVDSGAKEEGKGRWTSLAEEAEAKEAVAREKRRWRLMTVMDLGVDVEDEEKGVVGSCVAARRRRREQR